MVKSKQAPPPPTYYKWEAATRTGDIFVSAPLVRAKLIEDYLEIRKEQFLNGSDHRAVTPHLDIGSFLEVGPPRSPHDNVKIRIRAVTSARIKGELSDTVEAHTRELDIMLGKAPARTRPEATTPSESVSRMPQRHTKRQKGRG